MDKQKLKEFIGKLLAVDVSSLNEQQLAEHMSMVKQARSLAEAIPYALSAANANAEYERTRTHLGGYKGRVDTEVSGKDEYFAVMKALTSAAKQAGQHIECGLSDNKMSIFSDSMNSDELDEFVDDVLEQGLEEAQEDALMSNLKGLKSWQVVIMNNYYRGKYSDYSGRYFYVLATSAEEAKKVVLDNASAILQDLLAMKAHNGRKILPRSSAVRITPDRIGKIEDGTVAGRISTTGYKKLYSPQGVMMVKLSNGAIVDVQGQEQGVAEGSETEADIDKKIAFHQQGQAAAQYKGSMNKMHAAKIRELQAKKEALKQGVAESSEDTVRFVLHSERAYEAIMDRMGDLIDWDEFDYMKVPRRLWPKVQQIAADADGLGAENADDNGPEDNLEHYGVNEEISTEAYNRLKRVFDFSDYKG
jgi:hypothetical protein